MKNRDIFSQYIEMINRFEYVSNNGNTIHPSQEDEQLMRIVRSLAVSDNKYKELIKRIHSLPPKDRYSYLDSYYSEEKTIPEEKKEEIISKTNSSFQQNEMSQNKGMTYDVSQKNYSRGIVKMLRKKTGFVDNALYFSVASSVVLLLALIIALFYYYIS